ncbi:MAG: hypothetical protein M0Z95_29470 [Actinomycetota bacterium]|nr:hypothetical protein [Actinomycetota bacterium]
MTYVPARSAAYTSTTSHSQPGDARCSRRWRRPAAIIPNTATTAAIGSTTRWSEIPSIVGRILERS